MQIVVNLIAQLDQLNLASNLESDQSNSEEQLATYNSEKADIEEKFNSS